MKRIGVFVSARRRGAWRYCRSESRRYRRRSRWKPVAIEIEKSLAGAGTEYADLGGQRMGCGWAGLAVDFNLSFVGRGVGPAQLSLGCDPVMGENH